VSAKQTIPLCVQSSFKPIYDTPTASSQIASVCGDYGSRGTSSSYRPWPRTSSGSCVSPANREHRFYQPTLRPKRRKTWLRHSWLNKDVLLTYFFQYRRLITSTIISPAPLCFSFPLLAFLFVPPLTSPSGSEQF
jgi:hypothetical protein